MLRSHYQTPDGGSNLLTELKQDTVEIGPISAYLFIVGTSGDIDEIMIKPGHFNQCGLFTEVPDTFKDFQPWHDVFFIGVVMPEVFIITLTDIIIHEIKKEFISDGFDCS
jgi:hypothetical protein